MREAEKSKKKTHKKPPNENGLRQFVTFTSHFLLWELSSAVCKDENLLEIAWKMAVFKLHYLEIR